MAPARRKRRTNHRASTKSNDTENASDGSDDDYVAPSVGTKSVARARVKRTSTNDSDDSSGDDNVRALLQRGRALYKEDDKTVPSHVRQLYGQIGFVKWTNAYCPVLIVNPCEAVMQDNLPSGIYHAWMDKFEHALSQLRKKSGKSKPSTERGSSKQQTNTSTDHPSLPLLVYWYGTYYEYSVVAPRHIVFYEEACRRGYEGIPDFVKHRREHQLPLPYAYELRFLAMPQVSADMDKLPRDRRIVLPAIASNTTDKTTSRQQRQKNKKSAELEIVSSSVVLNEWHTLSLTEEEGARTREEIRTHERFVRQREQVIQRIHPDVKATFGTIGFCLDNSKQTAPSKTKGKASSQAGQNNTATNKLHPVLILSPFRCPPSPIRAEWFEKYNKWETSAAGQNIESAPCLVYWYGAFTCNQSSARPFSFVRLSQVVSYEQGVEQGQDLLAPDMLSRYQQNEPQKRTKTAANGMKRQGKLTTFQDWLVCGHWEMQQALKVDPADRWGGLEDFEENYRDDFEYYQECVAAGGDYSDLSDESSDDEEFESEISDKPKATRGRLQRKNARTGHGQIDQDDGEELLDEGSHRHNNDHDEGSDQSSEPSSSESKSHVTARKKALDKTIIEINDDDDDSAQTVIVLDDTTSCSSSSSSSCLTPLKSEHDLSDDDISDDDMEATPVVQHEQEHLNPYRPVAESGTVIATSGAAVLVTEPLGTSKTTPTFLKHAEDVKQPPRLKSETASDEDNYHADDELALPSTSTMMKVASKDRTTTDQSSDLSQLKPKRMADFEKSSLTSPSGSDSLVDQNTDATNGTPLSVDERPRRQCLSPSVDGPKTQTSILLDHKDPSSLGSQTRGKSTTGLSLKAPPFDCTVETPFLSSKDWDSASAVEFNILETHTASSTKCRDTTSSSQGAIAHVAPSDTVTFLPNNGCATNVSPGGTETYVELRLKSVVSDIPREALEKTLASSAVDQSKTSNTTTGGRIDELRKRKAEKQDALYAQIMKKRLQC
jgi:hypothetical protein